MPFSASDGFAYTNGPLLNQGNWTDVVGSSLDVVDGTVVAGSAADSYGNVNMVIAAALPRTQAYEMQIEFTADPTIVGDVYFYIVSEMNVTGQLLAEVYINVKTGEFGIETQDAEDSVIHADLRDGETHTLKIRMTAGRLIRGYIDGVELLTLQAGDFDAAYTGMSVEAHTFEVGDGPKAVIDNLLITSLQVGPGLVERSAILVPGARAVTAA